MGLGSGFKAWLLAHKGQLRRPLGAALGFAAAWALVSMDLDEERGGPPVAMTATAVPTVQQSPMEAATDGVAVVEPQAPEIFEPRITARSIPLKMRAGDTLIETLTDAGAPTAAAYRAVAALGEELDLRRLQVGQEIDLVLEEHQEFVDAEPLTRLASLSVRSAFDKRVTVLASASENGTTYDARVENVPTLQLDAYAEGVIRDSLFLEAERKGVPPEIIIELIRIFSFSVDFQREIWPGDGFAVYYKRETTTNGAETREGDILFASLTLRGKEQRLYRFDPGNGARVDYFDPDGKSVRRALMKTPIDGARLSSRYGKRKHPVLGYVRNHPGVDFSTGRSGTPIYAAGDGVILRASRYSTYGNYIRIRHNSTYETAYAHLSKYGRGIKKGARVKQGQIIGYTGATGRVTGPHLHYEVYVNGTRVNPTTLKLPSGRTLKGAELDGFAGIREAADNAVTSLQTIQQIAQAIRNGSDALPNLAGSANGASPPADTGDGMRAGRAEE